MKNLRVLHLASFLGNVGDNANHFGMRKMLSKNFSGYKLDFTEIEIRDFHRKLRFYDNGFADTVNQYDLFIFGGGNFFELWVDYSCNSTTVNIEIDILKRIKTPTVFYGLGLDDGKGISKNGIQKFQTWLDYVINEKRFLISLRNDGAMEIARKYFAEIYTENFNIVPDGGFFNQVNSVPCFEIPSGKTVIGINVAGDMIDSRFNQSNSFYKSNRARSIGYDEFMQSFVEAIRQLMERDEDIHVVLYAHIFRDFPPIFDFLNTMPDKLTRERISVAPYVQGEAGRLAIFSSYQQCSLIIGNRFHTNVCGIGMRIPTIGLLNYPKIGYLYKELDLLERVVDVTQEGFDHKLLELIESTLASKESIVEQYESKNLQLEEQLNVFQRKMKEWYEKLSS